MLWDRNSFLNSPIKAMNLLSRRQIYYTGDYRTRTIRPWVIQQGLPSQNSQVRGNGRGGTAWEVRFSSPLSFRKRRSYSRVSFAGCNPCQPALPSVSPELSCVPTTLATSQIFLQGRLISYPVKYCHFPQHLEYFCKPVFTVSVPKKYSVKNSMFWFWYWCYAWHLHMK